MVQTNKFFKLLLVVQMGKNGQKRYYIVLVFVFVGK